MAAYPPDVLVDRDDWRKAAEDGLYLIRRQNKRIQELKDALDDAASTFDRLGHDIAARRFLAILARPDLPSED